MSEQAAAVIQLVVYGKPLPQGNKTGFVNRHTGKVVMREGRTNEAAEAFKGWRGAVADEARRYQREHGVALLDGAVLVAMRFYMPKPASAPKRKRTWPTGMRSGDLDKLMRLVGDSLSSTLVTDDARIVAAPITKDYGDPPRVEIDIVPVPEGTAVVRLFHRFEMFAESLPSPGGVGEAHAGGRQW